MDEEDGQDEHKGDIIQSIDVSVFSPPSVASDPSGMMEVPNAERQRIEQEHRGILEEVLQEVLTEQPTPFEQIYVRYVERCKTREHGRRLDKPRVRDRVKVYLREMADSGKLKRVMKGREYFYVVAEENSKFISDSKNIGVFQANGQVKRCSKVYERSELYYVTHF